MRIWKKEAIYGGILLFSAFLIYSAFHTAFEEVFITQIEGVKNIFILSLSIYMYMVVGLLLTGFTAYLYLHLFSYMVGKLLALYLTLISANVCLAAATNYHNRMVNGLMDILLFISNVILYYLIGCLTLTVKKKYFRWIAAVHICSTMIMISLYLLGSCFGNFVRGKEALILGNYLMTFFLTIASMLWEYKKSTIYAQKQIKVLLVGFLAGIVAFMAAHFLPRFAVVSISDQQLEETDKSVAYSYIQMENLHLGQGDYSIWIFTGIIITMIYILMKREYISLDERNDLRRYTESILYLIIGDTWFLLFFSESLMKLVMYNSILIAPLLIHGYKTYKGKESIYNNHMMEELEEERQRIAIFLHDEILQNLIALLHVAKSKEEKEQLSKVIGEIRGVSHDLYPIVVGDLGVDEALKNFIYDIKNDYNIEIEYQYDYSSGVLPNAIALVLYRTVKELVTNGIKHSGCTKITVVISGQADKVSCMVSDNGKGFRIPENEKLLKSPHMGIYTIKKQISDLKGNVRIISNKEGSEIQIYIPLR